MVYVRDHGFSPYDALGHLAATGVDRRYNVPTKKDKEETTLVEFEESLEDQDNTTKVSVKRKIYT